MEEVGKGWLLPLAAAKRQSDTLLLFLFDLDIQILARQVLLHSNGVSGQQYNRWSVQIYVV